MKHVSSKESTKLGCVMNRGGYCAGLSYMLCEMRKPCPFYCKLEDVSELSCYYPKDEDNDEDKYGHPIRECQLCGKRFVAMSNSAKYCSDECREICNRQARLDRDRHRKKRTSK